MNRLTRATLLFACCALSSLPLLAETPAPSDTGKEPDVTVEVTAERTLQPVSDSIATTTVVTAKDIRKAGAESAADALRLVPGVTLRQDGGPGSLATISIRGSNSNQVLVLVDGQRISSPAFFGGTDLSKFPVAEIARIEVIRGPVSSLYGSESIGGVINIITKRPDGNGGGTDVAFGSNGRAARSLDLHGANALMKWQLSSDFPAFSGVRPNSNFDASNVNGRVTLPSIKEWTLSLRDEHYQDKLGLPSADPNHTGFFDPFGKQWWLRDNLDVTAERDLGNGHLDLRAYNSRQRLTNFDQSDWGVTDSQITGNMNGLEANYRSEWQAHHWLAGAEYREDKYDDIEGGSSPSTQHNTLTNNAFYAQDRWSLGQQTDLIYGARLDDHSTAGSKVTPRVGFTRLLSSVWHLRASYAEGFRAPNFVELYYPAGQFGPGYSGNVHLKPETSRQYEIGANAHYGANDLDVALFTTQVQDLIFATAATPYENVGHARKQGGEIAWGHKFASAQSLSLSYSYLEAMNTDTNTRLLGLPHNHITATVTQPLGDWEAALSGRWNDSRLDLVFDPVTFASKQVTLASLTVFDLTITRYGTGTIQPYLTIRNLGNTSYEEIAGFPGESRAIEAGIRTSW